MTTQAITPPAKHGSHWLMWWKNDPAEIDEQVRAYNVGWTSARYVAAYCLVLSAVITTAFVYFGWSDAYNFVDVAVFLSLAGFMACGHRWAMIAAMMFWTIEKGFTIAAASPTHTPAVIPVLLWWAAYMHAFWRAFQVEQARRQITR